jgi:flagellar export protein FliJ
MKRFRFRLESVRALRDVAERAAREQFGVAQQKLAAAEEAARAAAAARVALSEALAGARTGTFRPGEQVAGLQWLQQATRTEADAVRETAAARTVRDRAREDWLAARRRLQVMQKLEERARLHHRTEADKAEQTLLDELASLSRSRFALLS